jgi:hypothetical protein
MPPAKSLIAPDEKHSRHTTLPPFLAARVPTMPPQFSPIDPVDEQPIISTDPPSAAQKLATMPPEPTAPSYMPPVVTQLTMKLSDAPLPNPLRPIQPAPI